MQFIHPICRRMFSASTLHIALLLLALVLLLLGVGGLAPVRAGNGVVSG